MRFVRISSLLIGILMIVQWVFFLATGNVPELESAPVEIIFHIVIEVITGILLISVFPILKKGHNAAFVFSAYAQGMLGYTVVNSSGYFAGSSDYIFIIMFTILLIISIMNTVLLVKSMNQID